METAMFWSECGLRKGSGIVYDTRKGRVSATVIRRWFVFLIIKDSEAKPWYRRYHLKRIFDVWELQSSTAKTTATATATATGISG
jgi:hypothetical protein